MRGLSFEGGKDQRGALDLIDGRLFKRNGHNTVLAGWSNTCRRYSGDHAVLGAQHQPHTCLGSGAYTADGLLCVGVSLLFGLRNSPPWRSAFLCLLGAGLFGFDDAALAGSCLGAGGLGPRTAYSIT